MLACGHSPLLSVLTISFISNSEAFYHFLVPESEGELDLVVRQTSSQSGTKHSQYSNQSL